MKIIKHVTIGLWVLILLYVLTVGDVVICAQEKKQELSEADKKAQELMEQLATPGENHKFLDYFVGEWESLVKYYFEPGAEPFTYKEQITVKWILGGRFTRAILKGNLLGKEYEMFVYTGYDNYKKEFFAIQLSTLNTGYHISTGSLDKSGKTRTDTSFVDDPTEGKVNTKAVTTLLDRNTYRYEFYIVDDKGKETLIMEVIYNRK